MAMKGYSTFPKGLDVLVSYPGHLLESRSYPSADMQSAYSSAPAYYHRNKLPNTSLIKKKIELGDSSKNSKKNDLRGNFEETICNK